LNTATSSACRTEEELQYRAGVAHSKWIETYAAVVQKEAEAENIATYFAQDIKALVNESPAVLYHGGLHHIMGVIGLSDAGKGRAIDAARHTFKSWTKEWGVEGHSVFSCLSYFMYIPLLATPRSCALQTRNLSNHFHCDLRAPQLSSAHAGIAHSSIHALRMLFCTTLQSWCWQCSSDHAPPALQMTPSYSAAPQGQI
jgi:hypothetical protein